MTTEFILRRMPKLPVTASKLILPGRCRGDLDELRKHYGIPVERGPEELKDLPLYFGGN